MSGDKQLDLSLGEQYFRDKREKNVWLQRFFERAYAKGKAAGEREAEERIRAELAALAGDE